MTVCQIHVLLYETPSRKTMRCRTWTQKMPQQTPSVAKAYFIFKKYYTLFWKSLRIILFSVRYLKNTFYREKFSQRIKMFCVLFRYISDIYNVSSLSTQKCSNHAFGARISNAHIFQATSF